MRAHPAYTAPDRITAAVRSLLAAVPGRLLDD